MKYLTKNFYNSGYKKQSRLITLTFILLISIFYSVFVTPIITYKVVNIINSATMQVNRLPGQLQLEYTEKMGLLTNVKAPAVLSFKNFNIIIDTYNQHSPTQKGEEIVLRNKGIIVYTNGVQTTQRTYKSLGVEEFSLKVGDIKNLANSFSTKQALIPIATIVFLFYLLRAIFIVGAVGIIFGAITYMTKSKSDKDTYLQKVKQVIYLSPLLLVGFSISTITFGDVSGIGFILLVVAYFKVAK